MKKTNKRKFAFILSAFFIASNGVTFAETASDIRNTSGAPNLLGKKEHMLKKFKAESSKIMPNEKAVIKTERNSYQPYIQLGGTRFFHIEESKAATTADLFVPLWQNDTSDLVFTDLRINDRTGSPFEGNIHLGYRHLFEESQQAFGIYGAWDRKKTQFKNYFNQLTVGGEYWIKNWFIGANYYQPIGNTKKSLSSIVTDITTSEAGLSIINNVSYEKAMPGTDAEVGYEFIEGLMGYAGGYYFASSGAATVYGPRARLSYDWSPAHGRILGIFDKVGLEAGVQRDKPRGVTGYLSVNVRIGWLLDKKSELKGLSRHMIDPVRRDIDVVSGEITSQVPETTMGKEEIEKLFEMHEGSHRKVHEAILGNIKKRGLTVHHHAIDHLDNHLRSHRHKYYHHHENTTITENKAHTGTPPNSDGEKELKKESPSSNEGKPKVNGDNEEKPETSNSNKGSKHEQHQSKPDEPTGTQSSTNMPSDSNTGGSKSNENNEKANDKGNGPEKASTNQAQVFRYVPEYKLERGSTRKRGLSDEIIVTDHELYNTRFVIYRLLRDGETIQDLKNRLAREGEKLNYKPTEAKKIM